MGAQSGTGRKLKKNRTYTKRRFIKHNIKKRHEIILCLSALSVRSSSWKKTSQNKGIHPVCQGHSSETPPNKGSILSGRQYHSSETPGQWIFPLHYPVPCWLGIYPYVVYLHVACVLSCWYLYVAYLYEKNCIYITLHIISLMLLSKATYNMCIQPWG